MLRSLEELEEGFRNISEKSKEECRDELEAIRELTLDFNSHFFTAYFENYSADGKQRLPKYYNSLVDACFLELWRISGHILFLSCNGLYRNAFDNIRYILESIVQALYIDLRHPKTDLETKIEILKEVEDKREYHAVRLIDELKIDHKSKLKEEYKKLSRIIHPSHKQIIATVSDIIEGKGVPATIDCEEVERIYDSMKRMYDIFFFLYTTYFPEIKKSLRKNPEVINDIKVFNLTLLSKALKA